MKISPKNKSLFLVPMILALPLYGGPGCNVPQNDGGVYKSTDKGANWKQITTIEESKETLARADDSQLLVDPNNPAVVFLVTQSNGLFVSNQFGDSWKRILTETSAVNAIEADPSQSGFFYAAIQLNGRAKIIKTENGGNDWKEIYTEAGNGNAVTYVKRDPFHENTLMAVNSDGLVVRSDNRGETWQAMFPLQEEAIDFTFDPTNENGLWALTSKGLWFSQDGGANFTLLEMPEGGDMGTTFYLMKKFGLSLFIATDKGFYQSVDNGKSWRKIIVLNNPTDFPVRDFVVYKNNSGETWALAAGMTLYLSQNTGQTWKTIQFEITREINSILIKPDDPNQILVGAQSPARGGLGVGY
jgi:hypothetical protein